MIMEYDIEETYELEKFRKNAMIIFNHEDFWADSPRRGTALDVAALEDTFKLFRFEVETHNDLTRKRLFDVLNEFTRRDYKEYGCICVAVLTHGLDDGYLKAADARYRERDAFACFDCHANPSLVAKPIIFLIQACRGSYAANPIYQGSDVEYDAASREVRPSESDMIIFHSSFFGRASVRVVSEGSWFIQTVCQQIKLHASTEHLEQVFRRVRRVVALEKEYEGAKQMPVVTTTLLRNLYLKTRNYNARRLPSVQHTNIKKWFSPSVNVNAKTIRRKGDRNRDEEYTWHTGERSQPAASDED